MVRFVTIAAGLRQDDLPKASAKLQCLEILPSSQQMDSSVGRVQY